MDLEDIAINRTIDFFFTEPSVPHDQHCRGDEFSVLYLLRQELVETQGYNPYQDAETTVCKHGARNRLFASLSLMFTGYDLLAKFEQGDRGFVGDRYIAFLRSSDGAGLNYLHAELLYGVRNSLLHSFGVPDDDKLTKLGVKQIAIVQRKITETTMGAGNSIVQSNNEIAEVFIDGVYCNFLNTIGHYRDSLFGEGTDECRERFMNMFTKYGIIRIQQD
jgi:hypothetical protein